MKKFYKAFAILFLTAPLFAAESVTQPEYRVSTPLQSESELKTPALGADEASAWQKRREQSRIARQNLLRSVKSSSDASKEPLRNTLSKTRNESSRMEANLPKTSEPGAFGGGEMLQDRHFGEALPKEVREDGTLR